MPHDITTDAGSDAPLPYTKINARCCDRMQRVWLTTEFAPTLLNSV